MITDDVRMRACDLNLFFSFSSHPITRILPIPIEDYLPRVFHGFRAGTIHLQSRGALSGCQWPAMALSRSLGASIAGTCGVSSEPEAQQGGLGMFGWYSGVTLHHPDMQGF